MFAILSTISIKRAQLSIIIYNLLYCIARYIDPAAGIGENPDYYFSCSRGEV